MSSRFNAKRGAGFLSRCICIAAAIVISGCNTGQPDTPSYVKALRPQVKALLADTRTPGAVVLVRSPHGDWTEAFGTRALDDPEPVRVEDHFRIGSVTKTWTATVILQLVQEGLLALSDPVSKYLPDVPDGANITIEHLLTMRSGLFNYSTDPQFIQSLDANPEKIFTPDDLLKTGFSHPPYFQPGKGFTYSNTNTVLLGKIIEMRTGMPVEQAFYQRLFKRLGLTGTFFPSRTDTSLPEPFSHGYHFGLLTDTDDTGALPPAMLEAAMAGTLLPRDVTEMNASWAWTAGMGISTAKELAAFVQVLIGGGYLNDTLQAGRLASCFMPDASTPEFDLYCWGLTKHGQFFGHTGSLPGYNTYMGYDPITKTTIVVWTTLDAAPDGRLPAVELRNLIIAALENAAN
ncbi:MAG: serine hydrolase domain-containing protein [Noviherbaspirillum sp.]